MSSGRGTLRSATEADPPHAPRVTPLNEAGDDRRPRTLGVEEEFHLVDLTTRRLAPRAPELLDRLDDDCYVAEMQQCVVETNSDVTDQLTALREELVRRRTVLIETASRLGLGIVAAGAVPLAVPAELDVTETPRYRRMLSDYQLLAREQLICGSQVHVGVADRGDAIAVADGISPFLPVLLALSASSPYAADGSDTGYASVRTLIWSRWPTTGLSSGARDAQAFDRMVEDLVASGIVTDPSMLYFDIRPSVRVPTLELRICDSCPSVDTIVLIAGLFRALVDRGVREHRRGLPGPSLPPALGRAAVWRAARSGLEGELIDLTSRTARPAADVVRDLVVLLEPELSANGDWETVTTLADGVLLAGSSAERQRRAFRRRGRLTDVVDLLVSDTARGNLPAPARTGGTLLEKYFDLAGTESPPEAASRRSSLRLMFEDEAMNGDGTVRPEYREIIDAVTSLGVTGLRHRMASMESARRADGVTFRVGDVSTARVFPVDVVPRLIPGDDWTRLAAGVAQRALALDLFLRDVYGAKEIVNDGLLPLEVLDRAPGFRSVGRLGSRGVRANVCGLDLVQDRPGHWLVLEDNLRIPSGASYAVSNRATLEHFLPELTDCVEITPVDGQPAMLLETLQAAAPLRAPDEPHVALLTAGPSDSAYQEHRFLASRMGIPLVQPQDLVVTDRGARIVTRGRDIPVDVLYLRMDTDMMMSSVGADGSRLRDGMVDALHRSTVTVANAMGNGVGDDKAIYGFVPAMIEYYLGEKPLLESVPTYQCADREQRDHVLSHLDRLVTKPIDGYGGRGVIIGPEASDEDLDERRRDLIHQPEQFIGQDLVPLTTHPTFDGTCLQPHHVDLRVFVHLRPAPAPRSAGTPAQAVVSPAALTRVGAAGTSIVNSSAGGGSKDTWIVTTDGKG